MALVQKSVMALICIWRKVQCDGISTLFVNVSQEKKKYSVMALVQKVWWHLFAYERKYSVMALVHGVLIMKKMKVHCEGNGTRSDTIQQCDDTGTKSVMALNGI